MMSNYLMGKLNRQLDVPISGSLQNVPKEAAQDQHLFVAINKDLLKVPLSQQLQRRLQPRAGVEDMYFRPSQHQNPSRNQDKQNEHWKNWQDTPILLRHRDTQHVAEPWDIHQHQQIAKEYPYIDDFLYSMAASLSNDWSVSTDHEVFRSVREVVAATEEVLASACVGVCEISNYGVSENESLASFTALVSSRYPVERKSRDLLAYACLMKRQSHMIINTRILHSQRKFGFERNFKPRFVRAGKASTKCVCLSFPFLNTKDNSADYLSKLSSLFQSTIWSNIDTSTELVSR